MHEKMQCRFTCIGGAGPGRGADRAREAHKNQGLQPVLRVIRDLRISFDIVRRQHGKILVARETVGFEPQQ